jgi:uncharacterized protein (DUF952 family)
MTGLLYHLVGLSDWVASSDWPATPSHYAPPSLASEGFIHLSDADQVPTTAMRYYADVADLCLVTIRADRLTAEVKWEDLAGHGAFPHLYGPLNLDAVESVGPYGAGEPVNG